MNVAFMFIHNRLKIFSDQEQTNSLSILLMHIARLIQNHLCYKLEEGEKYHSKLTDKDFMFELRCSGRNYCPPAHP